MFLLLSNLLGFPLNGLLYCDKRTIGCGGGGALVFIRVSTLLVIWVLGVGLVQFGL